MSNERPDSKGGPEDYAILKVVSWLQKAIARQRQQIDVWEDCQSAWPDIDYPTFQLLWKTAYDKIIAEKDKDPMERKAIIRRMLQELCASKDPRLQLSATRELAELDNVKSEVMDADDYGQKMAICDALMDQSVGGISQAETMMALARRKADGHEPEVNNKHIPSLEEAEAELAEERKNDAKVREQTTPSMQEHNDKIEDDFAREVKDGTWPNRTDG